MRVRAGMLVPALLLAAVALTGCADETESYCGELADRKQELADLAVRSDEPGTEVLEQTLQVWRDLRGAAPGDIADEWSTLVFALENLVEAFERTGTTPEQYDPADPPEGLEPAEARRLEGAAAALRSPRVSAAGQDVEQHAKDVCQVNLGLAGQQE
jgi:hypothetical protein